MTLGYTFSISKSKYFESGCVVGLLGRGLITWLTFTGFKGIDPEAYP